jgi:hypothetical protein
MRRSPSHAKYAVAGLLIAAFVLGLEASVSSDSSTGSLTGSHSIGTGTTSASPSMTSDSPSITSSGVRTRRPPPNGPSDGTPARPAESPIPASTLAPVPGGPPLTLESVDGGVDYYGSFRDSLPSSPSYFPIGVWAESVQSESDTATDKAAGINVYVNPTDNSNYELIRSAEMHALKRDQDAGYFVGDEVDMTYGPGSDAWTRGADTCTPAKGECGYTVMSMLSRGARPEQLTYANYGKGVSFWETNQQASRFVNNYGSVVSDDNYWFTDDDLCSRTQGGVLLGTDADLPPAECHKAANYANTVARLRSLESPARSKPVWAFVEVGHPSSEPDWPSIRPPQIVAAVWASIIGGARGIIYFNHSFAGQCGTQHALRDRCYAPERQAVTTVDGKVSALAAVINAPFVLGAAHSESDVKFMVKYYQGYTYIFAISTSLSPQTAAFTLTCSHTGRIAALFEDRSLPLASSTFRDNFAGSNSVHIYRVDARSNCSVS